MLIIVKNRFEYITIFEIYKGPYVIHKIDEKKDCNQIAC